MIRYAISAFVVLASQSALAESLACHATAQNKAYGRYVHSFAVQLNETKASLQYFSNAGQYTKEVTRVDDVGETDLTTYTKLNHKIHEATWEEGWLKLALVNNTNEKNYYLGRITIENDFPFSVMCQIND